MWRGYRYPYGGWRRPMRWARMFGRGFYGPGWGGGWGYYRRPCCCLFCALPLLVLPLAAAAGLALHFLRA
ncbi:MAG TPA: hypothetical protein VF813_02940 [Anaerolineaceae bacterium]